MKRKILSLMLALMMCLTLALPCFAAETYTVIFCQGDTAHYNSNVNAGAECWGLSPITVTIGQPFGELPEYKADDAISSGTNLPCVWLDQNYNLVTANTIVNSSMVSNGEIRLYAMTKERYDVWNPASPWPPMTRPGTETKPTVTESKFNDVPADAWYAEAVNALADGGILAGKGNNKFDPEANITLAELAVICARLEGMPLGEYGGHWAGRPMNAYHLGSDDYWGHDFNHASDPAYRGDAITMLGGFARSHSEDNGAASFDFDNSIIGDYDEWFPDMNHIGVDGEVYATIGTYAKDGHNIDAGRIRAAYCYGVISGIDAKGSCAPYKTLTRAEVAQMCYNMGWTTAGCLK